MSYSRHPMKAFDQLGGKAMQIKHKVSSTVLCIRQALSQMKFTQPTPIQSATIPIALLGRDICACAATGTGKTAAFMLPVMERLLYKPKEAPVTRVLVLTPTRELAVQIHQVSRQLAQHTNIEISLSAGEHF